MKKTPSYSIEEQLSARSYVDSLDNNTLAYIVRTVIQEHCEEVLQLQIEGRKQNDIHQS